MTYGRKLLFWLITLVLITSCAPAGTIASPPTLNPTAINLFIVQTANVASIQTLDAMPPTATVTSTPRSTFTPEPTFTPVPIVTFPTSTPIQRAQYFRVKHDSQLAVYDYKSRTADDWHGVGLQTPEVFQLFILPKRGSGTHRTRVDGNWEVFIDALNNHNEKKLRYLKADNTALFNSTGFPHMESLTMGGNILAIDELQGNWGRVHTLDYVNPGSLKDVNYTTQPHLVQKFVVVGWKKSTKTTFWVNPPQGATYWPLVSSRPVWISLEHLEPFPSLPKNVVANTTQDIRTEPGSSGLPTGNRFLEGDTATITEYRPMGSNVWARMSGGGWIAVLLYQGGGPQYLTDWKMETVPPPPG